LSFVPQFARWLGRRGQRPLTPTRRVRLRPTLEGLETRNLLSTLTVTNPLDTGVSGDGSLRGEIAAAASGDQIVFADSLAGQTITLEAANGRLLLNKDLTIQGPGADSLTVSGNDATGVFKIADGATDTITGLTIADGHDGVQGGGIINHGALTLDSVTLCGNHVVGGTVGGGGIFNDGTLTIDHSTLSDNHILVSGIGLITGEGGGIDNHGTLTIHYSTLSGNTTAQAGPFGLQGGGGIANSGTLTLDHSTLSGNHADRGDGAGISNSGAATITNCTLSSNTADDTGGGIYNTSRLTIDRSTLSDNTAFGDGGGIENEVGATAMVTNSTLSGNSGGSGGGIFNDGAATIDHSTLSGNTSGSGGGVANYWILTIDHSTLSGNTANNRGQGGGILNYELLRIHHSTLSGNVATTGGGIANDGAAAIDHSTVSGNQASGQGGGISNTFPASVLTVTSSTLAGNVAAIGGGIRNSGTLSADNTILAGNSATSGLDLDGDLGSQGYNLIGNTQGGSGFAASDLLDVDPRLGPLQDNGGPTRTMAVLAGSPALNAGDPAQLGVPDQRGVVRSSAVNIGAYQASASAFVLTTPATATAGVPFDLAVTAVDAFGQTAVGYTGTVTFSTTDSNPGVVLPADYTFTTADAGVHLFPGGTTLLTAGSQTIIATDTGTGALSGSVSVAVSPAAADHLPFLQGPTDTAAGQTISPLLVAVVDAIGNVVTNDSSDTVTLSLGVNPAGGTLRGSLSVTVSNGLATFSDLAIDQPGSGYTLHASSGGSLAGIDSNPFNIL
jgi:hypothetical protein